MGKVHAPGVDGAGRGTVEALAAGKNTCPLAATLGSSCGVAAGPMVLGALGVVLPCASAKRSRLLPEFCDHQGHERDRFCLEFLGDWRRYYWF